MRKSSNPFPKTVSAPPMPPVAAHPASILMAADEMTLRDEFARTALHGELTSNGSAYDGSILKAQSLAEWCYRMADAMVKARRS